MNHLFKTYFKGHIGGKRSHRTKSENHNGMRRSPLTSARAAWAWGVGRGSRGVRNGRRGSPLAGLRGERKEVKRRQQGQNTPLRSAGEKWGGKRQRDSKLKEGARLPLRSPQQGRNTASPAPQSELQPVATATPASWLSCSPQEAAQYSRCQMSGHFQHPPSLFRALAPFLTWLRPGQTAHL